METNKTTSSCNNTTANSFNCGAYEQSEQDKQAKEQNKIQNLEDEINFYKRNINKKKKDIADLERSLRVAERMLKVAQEAERARKIKELLEANKGKVVIIEDSLQFMECTQPELAEDLEVIFNVNRCWVIMCSKNNWQMSLEYVTRVFVEAEI